MRKLLLLIMIFTFGFTSLNIMAASKIIKYDFDDVTATYTAKFTATPMVKPSSGQNYSKSTVAQSVSRSVYGTVYEVPKADSWIINISGGDGKSIEVLYGAVDFKKDGKIIIKDEFIKVSGINGSERFLSNSASYEYYEGTNKLKRAKTLFWSAKQIVGDQIIKNFTGKVKSVIMYREFDVNGKTTSIYVTFPKEDESGASAESFWTSNDMRNLYTADIFSLKESKSSPNEVAK